MDKRLTFPKTLRVRTRGDYSAVFEPRVRVARGPLVLYGVPTDRAACRFGLSTPRKVGNAVVRNRIRRLLRESFRSMQHSLPAGYDLLAVVRPHPPLKLADYQQLLAGLCRSLHDAWQKKAPKL